MRHLFIILLFFSPVLMLAQSTITNTVVDANTKQVINYCNILNINTQNGVITNKNGVFSIEINALNDTINISFLGYESRNILAKNILNGSRISLKKKQFQLNEVVIHSDNDYLYDILVDCRKILKRSQREQVSKAFFSLNTSSNHQPLEILECYYNAHQKTGEIDGLYLKNGRFALLPSDNRVFWNQNTSQVFNKMDLINRNEHLPDIILQFKKRGMRKRYDVKLTYSDADLFNISFTPKSDNIDLFSGEIWIDKNTYFIKKISLHAKDIKKHPFIAFADDSITNISLNTTYTFLQNDSLITIEHIVFDMTMTYYSVTGSVILKCKLPDIKRDIKISSLLYLYDYNKPFILPYFEYNNLYTDYRKISIIPYNASFWTNRKVLLTEEQREQAKIMDNEGYLINYDPDNYGRNFMKKQYNSSIINEIGFYEHPSHIFWSKKNRVVVKKDIIEQQEPDPFSDLKTTGDKYRLEVQILLDINPIDSVFGCKSYTIFDLTETFYRLETNEYSDTFVNIYFDICEIERRVMEEELLLHHHSKSQIDAVYKNTLAEIKEITTEYMRQVQRGNNVTMLLKWNKYVFNELGIDNFSLFQNSK